MLAAEGNHQECVALLAVAGADLNAKYGLEELTALHRYMRKTNHTVSYQKYWLLLYCFLYYSCSNIIHFIIIYSYRSAALGHFEVIQTLSAFGADFTASTAAGENAVYHATAAYKLLCVRLLGQRGCYYFTTHPPTHLTFALWLLGLLC